MARRGDQRRQIDGAYQERRDSDRVPRRRRAEVADESFEMMGEAINAEDYQQDDQEPRRRRRPQQRAGQGDRNPRGDADADVVRSRRARTRDGAPRETAPRRSSRRRTKPEPEFEPEYELEYEPEPERDLMSYFGETADFEVVEEEGASRRRGFGLASLFGANAVGRGAQYQNRPQEAEHAGTRGMAQDAPLTPEDLEAEYIPRRKKRARVQDSERTVRRERAAGGRRPEEAKDETPRRRRRVPQEVAAQDLTEIDGELPTYASMQERTSRTEDAPEPKGRQATKRRRRPAQEDVDAMGRTGELDRPARTASAEGDETSRQRRRTRPETSSAAETPESANRRRSQRAGDDAMGERSRQGQRTRRRSDDGSMGTADGGRGATTRAKADAAQAGEDDAKAARRRKRPRREASTPMPSGARQAPASEKATGAAVAAAGAVVQGTGRRKKTDAAESPASPSKAAAGMAREERASVEDRRKTAPPAAAARRTGGPSVQGAAFQGGQARGVEPTPGLGGGYDDFGGFGGFGGFDGNDYGLGPFGSYDQYDDLYGAYDQREPATQGRRDDRRQWEEDVLADVYNYGTAFDDGEDWRGGHSRRPSGDRRAGSRPTSLDWQRGLGHEGMTFEEDRRAEEAARTHRDARQRGAEERLVQDFAERQDWLPDFIEDYGPTYDSGSGDGRHEYTAAPYGLDDGLEKAIFEAVPEAAPKDAATGVDAAPIAQRPLWTPAPKVDRYAKPAFRPKDKRGAGGRSEDGEDSWKEFADLIARDAFSGASTSVGQAHEERLVGLAGASGPADEETVATGRGASATPWRRAGQDKTQASRVQAGRGVADVAVPVADDPYADDDLEDVDEFDNYDDYNPFDAGVLGKRVPEGVGDATVIDDRDESPVADADEEALDGDVFGDAEADAADERDAGFATFAEQREDPWARFAYVPFVDDAPESHDETDDAFATDDADDTGIWADAIIDDASEVSGVRDDVVASADAEPIYEPAAYEPAAEPVAAPVVEGAGVCRRVPNFLFGARVSEPEVLEAGQSRDEGRWHNDGRKEWADKVEDVEDVEDVEETEEVGDSSHDVFGDAGIEEGAVPEDSVDTAGGSATDGADAEEVPTEHVEVHLEPAGSDGTGDAGTFVSKWHIPWVGRRQVHHVGDEPAPRGPKRRRPVFLICYVLLVVGLVAAGFFAYQYTYDSIVRYERSRSSTFMDNLIDDLQAGGDAAARRKEQIISSLELGAHDSRDLLSARLDRGVGRPGYRLEQQGKAIDATDPVYTLYVDESPYLTIELHAVDSYVRFGILAVTDWEIADAYVFEAGAKIESTQPLGQGQSMEVSVPDGAIAYVNGTALTGEDLSEPPNILAGFVYASRFVNVPEAITYRVDGLHTAPEVWATDAAGNPVELSHSGSIYRATSLMVPNAAPEELPVDVLTLTETWSRFLTGDLGGPDVNYGLGQVTSFLVPGSDLYEQAVAYARGSEISFIMKHSLDSFSEESVNNCVRYNEDLFSCDVHFKKNMTLNATSTLRSDVFDNSLIFAYVDELGTVSQPGWYLVDMQPTGEVA